MAKGWRQHGHKHGAVLPLLLACVAGQAAAGDWSLDNQITLQLLYTDNLTLQSNGESGFVTNVRPSVRLKGEGRRLKGSFSYQPSLSGKFGHGEQESSISHHLSSGFTATLKEDTLFMDMSASAVLVPTTASAAFSRDGLNINDDLEQVFSLSLSPYSRHRFGSYAGLNLGASVDRVSGYLDTTHAGVNLSLASGPRFQRTPWSLSYSYDEGRYEQRTDKRSSLTLSGGYRINRQWLINASVANHNNEVYTSRSDAEGMQVSASAIWTPTPRTRAKAEVGHSYYGPFWDVDFSHQSRRTNWTMAYRQSLTNVNRTFLVEGFFVQQLDDGSLVYIPGYTYATLDEDYISRLLSTRVTVTGRRTELGLNLTLEDRDYEVTPASERIYVLSATARRDLSPKLSIDVSAAWNEVRSDLEADDSVYDIGLNAHWKVGRYSVLSGGVAHRRSERVGGGYQENRVSLTFSTKMF